MNWLVLAMGYDLMRSLAPHKPLFDSEWHAFDGMTARYNSLRAPEAVVCSAAINLSCHVNDILELLMHLGLIIRL